MKQTFSDMVKKQRAKNNSISKEQDVAVIEFANNLREKLIVVAGIIDDLYAGEYDVPKEFRSMYDEGLEKLKQANSTLTNVMGGCLTNVMGGCYSKGNGLS